MKLSVAANYIAQSSVPCGDVGKGGDDLPMPQKSSAVFDVVETEVCVDIVGSSNPVLSSSTPVLTVLSLRGSPSKKL